MKQQSDHAQLRHAAAEFCRNCGFDDMQIDLPILFGTLNAIFSGRSKEKRYCIRLRIGKGFLYEDVCKEAFALEALANKGSQEQLRTKFQKISDSKQGQIHLESEIVVSSLWYGWGDGFAFPGVIYPWVESNSEPRNLTQEFYKNCGKALAILHQCRFESFFEDIFGFCRDEPVSVLEKMESDLRFEINRCEKYLDKKLLKKLSAIKAPLNLTAQAVLAHNDFSIRNILSITNDSVTVIDWDNWKIDLPELDLVKMKHWTSLKQGQLKPDEALYSEFVNSYESASGYSTRPETLRLCEILWLLRVYFFEMSRREMGIPAVATFPDEGYYRDSILKLVD